MAKRITALLAAVLASFIFFSCSAIQDKSLLSVSVSRSALRAADGDSGGAWSLKVSISGGYSVEETFSIQEDSLSGAQTFTMDNLPAGQRITVDVNVYYGDLVYYKAVETRQITLAEGDNIVDIALRKAVGGGDISVDDISSISITAVDADGKSYSYSSSSDVPVLPYNVQISFILGTNMEFSSYKWYLNKNELSSTAASAVFVPAECDFIEVNGKNTLVCMFGNGSLEHAKEFVFKLDSETSSE